MRCLQDEGLPEHLRRNMCEFVRVVYVQDDILNRVTRNTGVSIWNDLDAAEQLPVARGGGGLGEGAGWSSGEGDGKRLSDHGEGTTVTGQSASFNPKQELKNTIRDYFAANTCLYYPVSPPLSRPRALAPSRPRAFAPSRPRALSPSRPRALAPSRIRRNAQRVRPCRCDCGVPCCWAALLLLLLLCPAAAAAAPAMQATVYGAHSGVRAQGRFFVSLTTFVSSFP